MSWKEDMISLMRAEGGFNNPSGIQLAVMTGPNTLKIGNMQLMPQDLYFDDRLINPTATAVAGTCPDGGGALTDKSSYLSALKAGDTVAIYKLSDTKYLVLGRMVSI